ncbi:MAG TPA: sigma-70 family RNA polymerase sigma factor [Gemmataceae bacterium]|jgi:RNA polymerase sigma-70 factor (ECF subfamily)
MCWNEVNELVRQAQAGDRVAFGELVRRFQGAVFAAALTRLRDAGEAQELAQEVFVHAMRKLPQLRDPRCFAGWLRRITARMAINRLTRRGPVRGADAEFLDAVPAVTAGPLEDLVRAEQRAAVQAGLRRLKPLDRQALEAFYLRGRSLKRIARELAVPVGTVKRRLHVARRRLKAVLEAAPVRRRRRELACA